MNVEEMTIEQLCAVPYNESGKDILCDSLILIPTATRHDSGFRCIQAVACSVAEPICTVTLISDVIRLDGIGGYGEHWLEKHGTVPHSVEIKGWSLDALPTSGCLRLFCLGYSHQLKISGMALSSLEVFAVPKEMV